MTYSERLEKTDSGKPPGRPGPPAVRRRERGQLKAPEGPGLGPKSMMAAPCPNSRVRLGIWWPGWVWVSFGYTWGIRWAYVEPGRRPGAQDPGLWTRGTKGPGHRGREPRARGPRLEAWADGLVPRIPHVYPTHTPKNLKLIPATRCPGGTRELGPGAASINLGPGPEPGGQRGCGEPSPRCHLRAC